MGLRGLLVCVVFAGAPGCVPPDTAPPPASTPPAAASAPAAPAPEASAQASPPASSGLAAPSASPAASGPAPAASGWSAFDSASPPRRRVGPRQGPPLAWIDGDKIQIKQQIHFETSATTILSDSDDVLDDVARVLVQNATMVVEIRAYTDARGSFRLSATLTQGRADAVKGALVDRGIRADRLIARGYTQDGVAFFGNITPPTRQRTRRIEFAIVSR